VVKLLVYNPLPELMTLPFIITLYLFLWVRYYNKSTKKERAFRRMVFFVIIASVLDVLVGYLTGADGITGGPIIVINTLDHLAATCSSFCLVVYVYDYIEKGSRATRIMTAVNQMILVGVMIFLLQNLITGNVFGYDDRGNYYEGPLFLLAAYGAPVYFSIYGLAAVIVYRKYFRRIQLVMMLLSCTMIGAMIVVQLALEHKYLMVFSGAAFGCFLIFLSHETPESYNLNDAMEELKRAREEEEQAKLAAIAADEAKTQFLSQMSHEIRTPINAIMGYNNIIMDDTQEDLTREYSRKARLAAKRLLDFFESLFEFVDVDSEAVLKEIAEGREDDVFAENEEQSGSATFTGAQDLRILVVDDTEMNVDLLVRILRSMGFETDTAPDGEKALEHIRHEHYDLIFMDHMMPVMDGMEAMRIIQEEGLCRDVPVIMLTANTIKGEKEKYIQAGFNEYLTKPFSDKSIKDVILKYLPVDEERINQSAWAPEWRQLQKELPFLRLVSAKEYFLDDADFYISALHDYATSPILPKLEEYIGTGDYYNYRALLCAVKDASRLIGADMLADRAAALEKLYIRGSIEELKTKHVVFMESTKKMLKQLASALYLSDRETEDAIGPGQTDLRPLVLAIDDEPIICTMINEVLKKNYRVLTITTGEEGIIRAQEDNPALILLDVKLGGMDGFDVMRALKSVEETADIPVVFMTADDSGDAEVRGFQCGAADFVRKPFVPEVLVSRVKKIIELNALQKHLRREIKRQTEKIGHLSNEVMIALSKAVDAKDKYTNDHSQRVAKYASWIGKQLGKTKKEQDDLYIIGLLHDVGKIGVHEEIINKPGRLTDEEYAEIKTHTTVGYEILKVITEMPEAAKCARWHHERYDGRGYPDGLAGTDIPETARIICVADSYDAMTSRRAYQALKPQSEVREEIIRCKGTQFDPIIADAMLSIIDEDTNYKLHG
jgi:putative nucleotidyltransferase with HDIG domain